MKKTLLTLGAVVAVAAGACAQGTLFFAIPSSVGINSVTATAPDTGDTGSDYFLNDGTGLLNVSVYYASNSPSLLSEAGTINTDAQSKNTLTTAVTLLNADFTQQSFTGEGGAAAALTQVIPIDYGDIDSVNQFTSTIGTGASITSGTQGLYALYVTYAGGYEGVLVLDGQGATYNIGGGSSPQASMTSNWGPNNLFLTTVVPEPASLALAGLGGLSMLFLRRRKA
jgi:PEP-CTERM motif